MAMQPLAVSAGPPEVVNAKVEIHRNGRYAVSATLVHADDGWDHYADKWEIATVDGAVIDTRVLLHPHERNKPFTRSLSNVEMPLGVDVVVIRAHCSVHGYGANTATLELPQR